ncbi:hypothetical protein DL769_007527 [Monosporascus sp. CRB-8-3]|nr:hypothetical protein DL769_007527 [Monosporascus sp. CRB-8-3]
MANLSIDDNWDLHREAIRHAYLVQEKSLKDISAFLEDAGFTVTVAQLEYKLKQWKFRRNLNKQAVTYIDYQVKKRKRDDKESDIVLSGVRLPPSKIQRAINRHSFVSTVDSLKMQQDVNLTPSHHVDTNMLAVSSLLPSSIHSTLRDTRGPSRLAAAIGIQMPEAYDGENLATAEALIQGNGNTAKQAALRMLLFQISNNLTDLSYYDTATTIFKTFRGMAMSNHEWPLMLSGLRGPTSESIIEKVFAAAVIHDQNDIAIPMLKAGASPTQSISQGWDDKSDLPIDVALIHNNIDLVVALLDAGAEVSHRTLSLAVQHCNSDLVIRLLRWNKTSDVSGLLLNKAIKYGKLPVIRHLIQEGDPFVYQSEYETTFGVTLCPTLIQVALYSRALDKNNETLNESDEPAELPSIQIIRHLLRGEPTIHPKALTYAAGHGRDDILMILHEAGGDIDGLDDQGCSPLSRAALEQQAESVSLILRLGARPDPVSSGANVGMTPSALHYASMKGNLEIVKLLLAAGADKNYPVTPQSWVSSPILRELKYTIENTLSSPRITPPPRIPPPPRQFALSPLQFALFPLQFALFPLRMALSPLQFSLFSLRFAPNRAYVETCITLINEGASLYDGVLCDAVCTGSQDLVTFLLDAGAAVDDDDDNIYTNPLSLAIFLNLTDIARLLMNRGVRVQKKTLTVCDGLGNLIWQLLTPDDYFNYRGPNGESLLEVACLSSHNRDAITHLLSVAPDLYESGALCSAISRVYRTGNDDGFALEKLPQRRKEHLMEPVFEGTALSIAILSRHIRLVELLASGGIVFNECVLPLQTLDDMMNWDPDDFFGECWWRKPSIKCSPLAAVAKLSRMYPGHWELFANVLLSSGYLPDYASLFIAVDVGCKALVERFLKAGADVNCTRDDIDTPLQRATRKGDIELVRLLLQEGAHVNAPPYTPSDYIEDEILDQSEYGLPRTALQAAVQIGHLELIKMLLEVGADVNAPAAPFMGTTALQMAAINGHLGIAKHLLEQGANVDAQAGDEYGRTALEGAAENGRIDMLYLLLHEGARTTGSHRRQYIRAICFAEDRNHTAAARLLRNFREWTAEDYAIWELQSKSRNKEYKDDEEDEEDEEERGYDIL